MRVLVAGATGAIGRRLVPELISRSHHVVGTSRTPENAAALRSLGAVPAVLDLLDPAAVTDLVSRIEPEAIVHEATALSGLSDMKHFDRSFETTKTRRRPRAPRRN